MIEIDFSSHISYFIAVSIRDFSKSIAKTGTQKFFGALNGKDIFSSIAVQSHTKFLVIMARRIENAIGLNWVFPES